MNSRHFTRCIAGSALAAVAAVVAVGATSAGAAVSTAGPGTVAVTPVAVTPSSSGHTVQFRYTAPGSGLPNGAVNVAVPRQWTAPQVASPLRAGYVTATGGALRVARRSIRVTSLKLCGGCSLTITYTGATTPAADMVSTFLTRSSSSGGIRLHRLAVQPTVTVGPGAPPPPTALVSDTFGRVVAGGWGTADIGGAYTVEKGAAADFSVDGTGGVFTVRNALYTSAEHILALPATNALDFAASFDVVFPANVKALNPKYGGVLAGVVARFHNVNDVGNGYYRMQLVWNANNGVPLLFLRAQDDSGKAPPGHFKIETNLGIDPTVDYPHGGPYAYHVMTQITGTNPTTVALKAWKVGGTEPVAWQLTGSDTGNYGPQTAGPVGVRASADLQSAASAYLAVTSTVKVENLVVTTLP